MTSSPLPTRQADSPGLGEQPWTVPADVHARWVGEEIPADDDLIEALIGDIEDLILSEFPDIHTRVATGEITPRRVTFTTVMIIHRHLRNPEGIRSTSEANGPYTDSRTYGGDEPGALALTDDDRRRLLGRRAGQRAFTIRVGNNEPPEHPLVQAWVNGPAGMEPQEPGWSA